MGKKKWDKNNYMKKSINRIENEEEDLILKIIDNEKVKDKENKNFLRIPLTNRKFQIDLEKKVGISTLISSNTPINKCGGWYCEVCDCQLKDSMNYLDHINGKRHQRKLGMNMQVLRSTIEEVKSKFLKLKEKLEKKENKLSIIERFTLRKVQENRKILEHKERKRLKKESKKKYSRNSGYDSTWI